MNTPYMFPTWVRTVLVTVLGKQIETTPDGFGEAIKPELAALGTPARIVAGTGPSLDGVFRIRILSKSSRKHRHSSATNSNAPMKPTSKRLAAGTPAKATNPNSIQDALRHLRLRVRELIPEPFAWWLELDHDISMSVRWIWLGHPNVPHCGGISDTDVTIIIGLLERVDWSAEVTAAMESVEAFEREALTVAQKRRRLKITDKANLRALDALEMPKPVPSSLAEKKSELGPIVIPGKRVPVPTLEELMAAGRSIAADDEQADPDSASDSSSKNSPKTTRTLSPEVVGDYALTRSKTHIIKHLVWEEFETLRDLLLAIRENPEGTFERASVCGFRIDGPTFVERMLGGARKNGFSWERPLQL